MYVSSARPLLVVLGMCACHSSHHSALSGFVCVCRGSSYSPGWRLCPLFVRSWCVHVCELSSKIENVQNIRATVINFQQDTRGRGIRAEGVKRSASWVTVSQTHLHMTWAHDGWFCVLCVFPAPLGSLELGQVQPVWGGRDGGQRAGCDRRLS